MAIRVVYLFPISYIVVPQNVMNLALPVLDPTLTPALAAGSITD